MTHINGRNVYLSVPMTGIEDFNRAAFNNAEEILKSRGAAYVYNPADNATRYVDAGLTHEQCMYYSLYELLDEGWPVESGAPGTHWYEVLVSLPGWEQSAGARLERTVAEACGIEVCNIEDVTA